ncbi:MAG: MopE-related protein [Myxococcales bacterium]|jgi:hypothetical protein
MPALPQTRPSCAQSALFSFGAFVFAASCLSSIGACGEITCPEPLSAVEGSCEKLEPEPESTPEPELTPETDAESPTGLERCDGIDNDGDDAVDENWPALGTSCGERAGVGECTAGTYVCAADGRSIVCQGATGPTAEICDGKDNDCDGIPDNASEVCDGEDNDCDGLIDEGVLAVKSETFADRATVASVAGGFVVTRIVSDRVRVETYDARGNRTGHHDDIDKPAEGETFIESDGSATRVLATLGKLSFHMIDIDVDAELVPIVLEIRELHSDWRQGIDFGVYEPPHHPRVVTSPARFVGYRDLATFAMNPLSEDLSALGNAPIIVAEVPIYAPFDAAGPFLVWEQAGNLRAAWLLDDGRLELDIDVGRGDTPAVGVGHGGPGVAYLFEGMVHLTELSGLTLQCAGAGFCNAPLGAQGLSAKQVGPTALAYDRSADTWFVVAGRELLAVGRDADGAVVKQVEVLDAVAEAPQRVDVAVSDGTAAVLQTAKSGASALTFLGCL